MVAVAPTLLARFQVSPSLRVMRACYAGSLVRAVGLDVFTKLASGELDPDDLERDVGFARMVDTFAAAAK
ncbi:hypothetical protein JHV675_50100 [Mycobacterium avium subsp. hominissuis]